MSRAAKPATRNSLRQNQSSGPSRICIVTRDLYGVRSLTDSGAAALGLAQLLAEAGDTVTILWVPRIDISNSLDASARSEIAGNMASNYMIHLEIISDSPYLSPHLHSPEKASLAVYYRLKSGSFDEVYCALDGGLAYYTLIAREMALLTQDWSFTLLVHAPTEWLAEADKQFFRNLKDISTAHMERYCLENAVFAAFNSNYIRQWVRQKGWRMPHGATLPSPLAHELRLPKQLSSSKGKANREAELGIWPGWEFQRGLTLFCDALDRLASQIDLNFTLNVFGPLSRLLGENTGGLILRRARQWRCQLRFFPRLTEKEALEYLRHRNGIAVLPELTTSGSRMVQACIDAGVSLITTNSGSNPELVKSTYRNDLCEPASAALADRIARALAQPPRRLEPLHTLSQLKLMWNEARAAARTQQKRARLAAKTKGGRHKPLVSVVIAHYDRPEFLSDAIKSVEGQDYPSIEVIVVDDGSVRPESHAFLKALEPRFRKRGWTILRQQNSYLGAARNSGIKASRGRYILFLDDDNALLETAVSTFVTATEASEADICTSMSKVFLGPHIPKDTKDGLIEYFPLGGSLDFALIHNSFGDANAMIRRSVFDKIGYLLEDRGFVASDWEFFARAALAGLKVRIIPEATYWYRSSPEGMFRSAHWYDTRQPILKLFQKNNFRGLDYIYQLVLANTTDDSEQSSYHFRLRYNLSNKSFEELDHFVPDSDDAIKHLAAIAASEGRGETALNLLGQVKSRNFAELAYQNLTERPTSETYLTDRPLAPVLESTIEIEKLKTFIIASSDPASDPPLSYVETPHSLLVQAAPGAITVATLPGALPVGTAKLEVRVKLPEDLACAVEVQVALLEPGIDALGAIITPGTGVLVSSGWLLLNAPYEARVIKLDWPDPGKAPTTLVLAARCQSGAPNLRKTMVQFSSIKFIAFLGDGGKTRHPRMGAPPDRQPSRLLSDKEIRAAKLVTNYPGERPLLEFPANEAGFILRPSRNGVVEARLEWAFPAFARGVVASVEIAHDEASPFEFAMALVRPPNTLEWNKDAPTNSVAFSGWHKVKRKFELHEFQVELREAVRYSLSLCAAIRLPPGSHPIPSQTFWRKLVLVWDN